MCDADIQETARFVREFVTMSLVPWMEKCVLEWNETVRQLGVLDFSLADRFVVYFITQTPITTLLVDTTSIWSADLVAYIYVYIFYRFKCVKFTYAAVIIQWSVNNILFSTTPPCRIRNYAW